ncbi:MAG TPA: hypothetical protein VE988_01965, partial [Gemmataceae bacterium]|nr:hypothetical protein [Gemmataceae bacterium]
MGDEVRPRRLAWVGGSLPMIEVVQLQCPHCRNDLRVPVAWAEQPMRCKFCQQAFQARRRPAVAISAVTVPQTNNPEFPVGTPVRSPAPRAASRGNFPIKAIAVAGLVFAGVGVAAILIVVVLGSALQQMFHPSSGGPQAKIDSNKGPETSPSAKAPPPETAKTNPDTATGKVPVTTAKGPVTSSRPPQTDKGPKVTSKDPPDNPKKKPDDPKKEPDPPEKPPVNPTLQHILDEIALFPAGTGGKVPRPNPANLPAFPANVLETYAPGYINIMEFRNREGEWPLRASVAKTIAALNENDQGFKKLSLLDGKQFADPKQLIALKNKVKNEQDNVAQRALVLKDMVKDLVEAGEKYRDGETKRCQALFDYALLKLKARVIHVYEYNYTLALVRSDSLVPLEDGNRVYRLVAQEKVTINEPFIKQYVKDLKKG